MIRILFGLVLGLAVLPLSGISEVGVAQSANAIGSGPIATCSSFFDRTHAQAVSDASRRTHNRDIYELDSPRADDPDLDACESDSSLGEPGDPGLATCANLRHQQHAQALYEASEPGDYDLDVVDGTACYSSLQRSPAPPSAPSTTPAPTKSTGSCPSGIMAEVSHAIACSEGGGSGFADIFEDDDPIFVSKADGGSGIGADIADVASGTGSSSSGNTFVPSIGTFQTQFTQQAGDDAPRQLTSVQKARKLKAKKKRKRKAKRARQRAIERERLRQEHQRSRR